MAEIRYIGAFLTDKLESSLQNSIEYQHVTFAYEPPETTLDYCSALYGQTVVFKCVGYGNNGINEGFKVELIEASPEIKTLFSKIAVPHITCGLSEIAEAVNTRFLNFLPIEPFLVSAVFGFVEYETETPCFTFAQ